MRSVSDMAFFAALVKSGSLTAVARDFDVTASAASKWLAQLEGRLGVRLVARTTRRFNLTQEGEIYLAEGRRIQGEIDDLEQSICSGQSSPVGLLRVHATPGFGRTFITPAISSFALMHPNLAIDLTLTDRSVNLEEEGVDVAIRLGPPHDGRIIARKIADHQRRIWASPLYLQERAKPLVPNDLVHHNCLIIRQGDLAYGQWHFIKGKRSKTVKVRGTLSSNEGSSVLNWAIHGHGVILRSEWEAAPFCRAGKLVILLDDYKLPPADIYIVYQRKQYLPAKVRVFAKFLEKYFSQKTGIWPFPSGT